MNNFDSLTFPVLTVRCPLFCRLNSFTLVGLTDMKVESVFRWLNGDILRYKKWLSTEPNFGVAENCVAVISNGFLDYPCEGLGDLTRTLCSTAGN